MLNNKRAFKLVQIPKFMCFGLNPKILVVSKFYIKCDYFLTVMSPAKVRFHFWKALGGAYPSNSPVPK